MIRLNLTPAEWRHYSDLLSPPLVMRAPNHSSPEGQREVRIAALESVIGFDYPRARIGLREFEVYGSRGEKQERWA